MGIFCPVIIIYIFQFDIRLKSRVLFEPGYIIFYISWQPIPVICLQQIVVSGDSKPAFEFCNHILAVLGKCVLLGSCGIVIEHKLWLRAEKTH
ncbi:hypothetical protein SDC9_141443 [bioreactor metagenome]|uniref:Uncharacterized protein n=1 Tax=bioreactor metagenome TaxID=1076179 RepID=A0A645DY38_9ZZZZ